MTSPTTTIATPIGLDPATGRDLTFDGTCVARRPGERNCAFVLRPISCGQPPGTEAWARHQAMDVTFFKLCTAT